MHAILPEKVKNGETKSNTLLKKLCFFVSFSSFSLPFPSPPSPSFPLLPPPSPSFYLHPLLSTLPCPPLNLLYSDKLWTDNQPNQTWSQSSRISCLKLIIILDTKDTVVSNPLLYPGYSINQSFIRPRIP